MRQVRPDRENMFHRNVCPCRRLPNPNSVTFAQVRIARPALELRPSSVGLMQVQNLVLYCMMDELADPDLQGLIAEETSKILSDPKAFKLFKRIDGLLYYTPKVETRLLCISQANDVLRKMLEILLDQAYQALGHYGSLTTSNHPRRQNWSNVQPDMDAYRRSCPNLPEELLNVTNSSDCASPWSTVMNLEHHISNSFDHEHHNAAFLDNNGNDSKNYS